MHSKKNPRVYLDLAIGDQAGGRVTFELFASVVPETAENFRALCTGEKGKSAHSGLPLSYVGCKFFRVQPGFVLQSGDFEKNTGDGGESIYGPTFPDENFEVRHGHAGVLSMANRGKNSNSSQFFVTLGRATQLDGKHVAFGQCVGGMEVIQAIEKIPVTLDGVPRVAVFITDCGEVRNGQAIPRPVPMLAVEAEGSDARESEPESEPDVPVDTEAGQRLAKMKQRLNQARVLNRQAVLEEQKLQDPAYAQQVRRKEKLETFRGGSDAESDGEKEKRPLKKSARKKRYLEQREYLSESAASAQYRYEKDEEKQKNAKDSFGWQVFSQDSLYRAHEKRIDETQFIAEEYVKQKEHMGDHFYNHEGALPACGEFVPSEAAKERLVNMTEKQIKNRAQFKRRRPFYEEQDISHINERNRMFNKKLERYYKEETAEIKANLERGTSL